MKTYIVLLRGVMPVGKNKVPMADLRVVLAKAGFKNVQTYIQSGNVILDSDKSKDEVKKLVHKVILEKIGPDLEMVVATASDVEKVLSENPFRSKSKGDYNLSRVFFMFLVSLPEKTVVKELMDMDFGDEKLVILDKVAYFYIPESAARSRMNVEVNRKKYGVVGTMRNFNTLNALVGIVGGIDKNMVERVCSRGHVYAGKGICPKCYPGGVK